MTTSSPGSTQGLADVADDRVGARADGHLLEADAVLLGEGAPEAPGAAVRVAVELERRARDRLLRLREGTVRPLVRGELDDALEAELALHLLDRLARLVRNEPRERRADQRRVVAPRFVAHVAGSGSGAATYSPTISLSPRTPSPLVRRHDGAGARWRERRRGSLPRRDRARRTRRPAARYGEDDASCRSPAASP